MTTKKKQQDQKPKQQKPVDDGAGMTLSVLAILVGTVIALNRFDMIFNILIGIVGFFSGIVWIGSGRRTSG